MSTPNQDNGGSARQGSRPSRTSLPVPSNLPRRRVPGTQTQPRSPPQPPLDISSPAFNATSGLQSSQPPDANDLQVERRQPATSHTPRANQARAMQPAQPSPPPPYVANDPGRSQRTSNPRAGNAPNPQMTGNRYGNIVFTGDAWGIVGNAYDPNGAITPETLPSHDFEGVYADGNARVIPGNVPIEAVEMLFGRGSRGRSRSPRRRT